MATLGKGSSAAVYSWRPLPLPSARHCHSERSYFAGRHSTKHALPSVYGGHSAKYIFFPTFVLYWTLGKPCFAEGPTASFFAECQYSGHSAKSESLPSVTLWALGTGSVAVTWRRDCDFSLPSTRWHSANLCRVPDKKYSANKPLPMYSSSSFLCRVSHSIKPLPNVFKALPIVLDTWQSICFRWCLHVVHAVTTSFFSLLSLSKI
jgi:hypothetical protein